MIAGIFIFLSLLATAWAAIFIESDHKTTDKAVALVFWAMVVGVALVTWLVQEGRL